MAVGAATILGSFAARLGIDTNDYGRGVLQAQAWNAAFGQSFANFVANPLLGAVNLFKNAASAAIGHGQAVLSDAEAVQRLGQQTGATTELIQALQTRMDIAGKSIDQGNRSLLVLNRTMEEARRAAGPMRDTFEELGVTLAPGRPLDVALGELLDGLIAIPDPGRRSAIAMKVLGEEAGPNLVNAVGGGSDALREMIREGRQMGQVFGGDTVNSLADLNTTLGYTDKAIEGIQRRLVAGFLRGVSDEANLGSEDVLATAEAVNTRLVPALELVGQIVGDIADSITTASGSAEEIFAAAESPVIRGLVARGFAADHPILAEFAVSGVNTFDRNNSLGWRESGWYNDVIDRRDPGNGR